MIKPCPNCGSRSITLWVSAYPKRLRGFHLECDKCHFCGKRAMFKFTAEIAWNRSKKR